MVVLLQALKTQYSMGDNRALYHPYSKENAFMVYIYWGISSMEMEYHSYVPHYNWS